MSWSVIEGDCREVMAGMDAGSVDAVVCDPPYGLEFMGRAWDRLDSGVGIDAAFGHWLAGFTDGEGCFSVHRKPQATLDCQFSITLRGDDMPILERCHRETGLGTIAMQHPEGMNPKARWTVSSKADCAALRDLFRAFPLRAKKAREFDEWSVALDEWLRHERGEWDGMQASRERLMAMRDYEHGGVRIDPMQMWHIGWAREALRVLKPGGHLLAFGGTRTIHRLTSALEDAGFEIRDTLCWLYGQGFPKSLDISKAIDKAAGAEREVIGEGRPMASLGVMHDDDWRSDAAYKTTAPATPDAERWAGWGTALKPGFEPIVLARKPLAARNIAANVLEHGTGGLNVAGCRLEANGQPHAGGAHAVSIYGSDGRYEPGPNADGNPAGRWPPNVAMDEEAARLLDESTGDASFNPPALHSRSGPAQDGWGNIGVWAPGDVRSGYGDTGGPSRFFYVAKASRAERGVGLDGGGLWGPPDGPGRSTHPTVKPIALMRWLCRLVTPPGGLVLDPFLGSGTTGIAALAEGFRFVGIEREAEYVKISRLRIAAGSPSLEKEVPA